MNIVRMVKLHAKINGWPNEVVRVGPATCGIPRNGYKTECQTVHAFARSSRWVSRHGDSTYAFTY